MHYCIVPKDWLLFKAAAFENPQTQMVCTPVNFHRERNLLQRFQSLDFLGLMGITGAGMQLGWHQMANGANLAYRKQAFESVGAYSGNEHLASGDDLFLVQVSFALCMGMPAPYTSILLFQIALKATFDYLFLSEMARFFKREDLLRSFLPAFILHTLYIHTLGTASLLIKKFKFKGQSAQ